MLAPPGEMTNEEREPDASLMLEQSAGESVGLLAEKRFGSEKSGKASSWMIEPVSTVKRTCWSPFAPPIPPPSPLVDEAAAAAAAESDSPDVDIRVRS